jgi:hypothetical protein
MKKALIISAIACSLFACKKESKQNTQKATYYVKIVAVDNDGVTQTETKYKTITVTK